MNNCGSCMWATKCESERDVCEYYDSVEDDIQDSVEEETIEIHRIEYNAEYEEYLKEWE